MRASSHRDPPIIRTGSRANRTWKRKREPTTGQAQHAEQGSRCRDRTDDGQSLSGRTIVHVDNRYLVVWVREHGAWKFVAYQPTPIIDA